MPYNRDRVVQAAERVERGLIRDGLRGAYCEQICQFISREVAIHLATGEIASWSGPCQYITHHGVLKDSLSTFLWVVTNSSFNIAGYSLISCLASGPNSLNSMLDVMGCWSLH